VTTPEQIALTSEQQRFADDHGATSCVNFRKDALVCIYSERADKTTRWIIDRRGRLLERTVFRCPGVSAV